jgi:hypothetical protein
MSVCLSRIVCRLEKRGFSKAGFCQIRIKLTNTGTYEVAAVNCNVVQVSPVPHVQANQSFSKPYPQNSLSKKLRKNSLANV